MVGKAALLCLLALLAIAASPATAESNDVTSNSLSGVPRRLLSGEVNVNKNVKFALVSKEEEVVEEAEEEQKEVVYRYYSSEEEKEAAEDEKEEEVVVVFMPANCKLHHVIGHITPECKHYYKAAAAAAQAGRKN